MSLPPTSITDTEPRENPLPLPKHVVLIGGAKELHVKILDALSDTNDVLPYSALDFLVDPLACLVAREEVTKVFDAATEQKDWASIPFPIPRPQIEGPKAITWGEATERLHDFMKRTWGESILGRVASTHADSSLEDPTTFLWVEGGLGWHDVDQMGIKLGKPNVLVLFYHEPENPLPARWLPEGAPHFNVITYTEVGSLLEVLKSLPRPEVHHQVH